MRTTLAQAMVGGAFLALLSIQPASASILWGTTNIQYDNVNFAATDPTGSTVTGTIQGTSTTVLFSDMSFDSTPIDIHASHGVASISSGDATIVSFDTLTFTAQAGTAWYAGDFKLDETNNTADGTVTFSAYYGGVLLDLFNLSTNAFAISDNGQHPYNFITFAGEKVDRITITSTVPLADLKQLSLSLNPVPLPAALPLFASGAGVMGLLGWWRKKRKASSAA